MISSQPVLSHDDRDELLRGARSNVGLVADTIWAPIERDDCYRKLNGDLWKRICKIAASYNEITSTRPKKNKRVRDVIPESRLSVYGDFEYEDDAEEYDECETKDSLPIKNGGPTINARVDDDEDDEDELKEPWLLDEVEEYIAWVKKAWKCRRPIGCKPLSKSENKATKDSPEAISNHTPTPEEKKNVEEDDFKAPQPPRFLVTNVSEAQLEGRIFSESIRSLWRSNPGPTRQHQQQQQQQQEQLVRGLQRELGLLRPQPQKRSSTPSTTSSSNSSSPIASDLQQTHYSFQNERLKMPSRCQYSYVQAMNMVHRPLAPLCVDVPEFFPKGPGVGGNSTTWPIEDHRTSKPIQYYSENPYQEEIYPYKGHVQANRKTVAVYQNTLMPMVATPIVSAMMWPTQAAWTQQRMMPAPMQIHHPMAPPTIPQPPPQASQTMSQAPQPTPAMCPSGVHRPIRIQEAAVKPAPIQQPQTQAPQVQQQIATSHKGQIPVYQRQAKLTQDYGQQRRKNQGVDFNNLILLTKSAMKVRRSQTKATKKFFAESTKLQNAAAVVAKSEAAGSSRWFEKGSSQTQQKRERDYVTVSIPKTSPKRDYVQEAAAARTEEEEQTPEVPASRKRLYRDVLESSAAATTTPPPSTTPTTATPAEENNFEKRYDELEKQAMEQYRTSEECLAQRYQELEQQAMEQYRTAESSESINADFEKNSTSSQNEETASKPQDNEAVNQEKSEHSSGFGKCNLSKKANAEDEKGEQQEDQRIKILKPESNVHRASSEGSLRPIAVARRLNVGAGMGANSYLRESKNTIRVASEKIVKTSSLSSLKRRLMPMSPLDRNKSGGSMMMRNANAGLDPVKAVPTLDKHVGTYYRTAKVFHHHHRHHHHLNHHRQNGSGDDKANNIGVWLSDFWS